MLFILNLALIYALLGVLALITLNVVLGIALALMPPVTFSLQKLPQFLTTEIPYFLALTALVAIAQINFALFAANLGIIPGYATGLAVAALAAYTAKIVQEIAQKVMALFGVGIAAKKKTN
jgi:predicted PhzF superfamily epimerase YddE/YHI9